MYVWYGTNKYNFEKLENPPAFEPTLCVTCKKRINLGTDAYSVFGDDYSCEECTDRIMAEEPPPDDSGPLQPLNRGKSPKRGPHR
jgi:DNA-directed RNA polymerase subunit RPC12/RpoP